MKSASARGKLRIGDDWNAITIIALSQSNPLKAIAELVENAIDARARHITLTRGREHGNHYLSIRDDGEGIPLDDEGNPDFRYVATHICDSVKRRLKADGAPGLQGEFGIGLLSFWTIGESLTMSSMGADQRGWQMVMRKGDPGYAVSPKRTLFAERGTEVKIAPLLEGIRSLTGEKIQWYLASELRDRIRQSQARVVVIDKLARKQYTVEPRQFEGRLLHALPPISTPLGDAYVELYLNEADESHRVALYRHGTRVLEDLSQLDDLAHAPWTRRCLQGLIDVPFLNLTPGTRTGIIHDQAYAGLRTAMQPLEEALTDLLDAQQRAEEEQASRELLRAIQRALREALLSLPAEEYDWFDIHRRSHRSGGTGAPGDDNGTAADEPDTADDALALTAPGAQPERQRQFFEFAGPLHSVTISPASSLVRVGEGRALRALPRDRAKRRVEADLQFRWSIAEGAGTLEQPHDQETRFLAPAEPGLTRVRVEVTQHDVRCEAEALVTVTEELLPQIAGAGIAVNVQGLPGYTFDPAPGALWRSRFDAEQNLIVINNAHRDFVYAGRAKALKLRYLVRLFAKELVLRNFRGLPADQLLERMVELSLRTEEHL
jgi:hypothetical protein